MKSLMERELAKKRPTINRSDIFNFFWAIDLYKKIMCTIKFFLENLGLLVKTHFVDYFLFKHISSTTYYL
jgi:hypothetical protein